MKRRDFVKAGGASAVLGLSGCIEPVQDLVDSDNNTDNQSDNETDGNGTDNETDKEQTEEPTEEPTEVTDYRELIPNDGFNGEDGVFAFHVELSSLTDEYSVPYNAFDGLPLDSNPVALSPGNALQSAQAVIENGLQPHALRSDLLSALEFDAGSSSFEVDEFLVVEDMLFFSGNLQEQELRDFYGLSEDSQEFFTVYNDVSGDSTVGVSDKWFSIPLKSAGVDEVRKAGETVSENRSLYDGRFGDAFGQREDGVINVSASGDGLSALLEPTNENIGGVATSAYTGSNLRTEAGILLTENDEAFVDDVGREAEQRTVTREGDVVTVENVWF